MISYLGLGIENRIHPAGTFGAKSWRWLEGSEGRKAIEKETSKQEAVCDEPKYSVLAPNSKSIIEEWRDPPKYTDEILRNNRTYKECAVDVVIDHYPQDFPRKFPQSSPLSLRVANDNANAKGNKLIKDNKLIKIKKLQSSGTVKSIPIKDYQASIAHNIGTLRRVAPQSQFESLVSEPERNIYASSKKRIPMIGSLHHRTASQTTCTASQIECQGNVPKKLFCHFCDDQRECFCVNIKPIDKNNEDNQYFNTEEQQLRNGSDINEYFRRNSWKKFDSSDHGASRHACVSSRKNTTTIATDIKDEKVTELEKPQLAEGHVGRKISTYEQNVQRSLRTNPTYRSVLDKNMKGHWTIGVPLVGMHNACGLPIVATWKDQNILKPLRVNRRIIGTIYKSPHTLSNVRRRNKPKRKAPQPDPAIIVRNIDHNIKRSTIKSVAHLDAMNSGLFTNKHCRSSYTASKVGSLSSKNSFKKRTASRKHGIKVSSLVDTFDRKLIKANNAKRTTVYAKDNREEAVQVLKKLCLNPLARTNSEADMMW